MSLTPSELTKARDWIADLCCAPDYSDAPDWKLEAFVRTYYAGGLAGFKEDCPHF